MAVKITSTGIDTVQDNIITSDNIADNEIRYEDLPMGVAIQTIRTVNSTKSSFTTGTSDTVYPGSTITITPKLDNSHFLIQTRQVMEIDDAWNVMFNIQRNGSRINANGYTANRHGISAARQTYANAANDNNSTLEIMTLDTLDKTGSTAGTPITYRLVCSSDANRTTWVNRTFGSAGTNSYETGTSEIIITEYKGY